METKRQGDEMNLTKLFLLLGLVTLVSCGKQGVGSQGALGSVHTTASVLKSDIIVGPLDWTSVSTLNKNSAQYRNSKFVGDIQMPARGGGRCTGFLINTNILMTNNHCFRNAADVVGAVVSFNHEVGQWKTFYKCDKYLGGDKALDFALVKCQGNPGARYGFAKLSSKSYALKVQQAIYVIEQNCDYFAIRSCDYTKKIAFAQLVFRNVPISVKEDGTYKYGIKAIHLADTLGGSSGSPIFSNINNKVVALHNMGIGDTDKDGRGDYNMGVPMSQIVSKLKRSFSNIQIFTR
jgi:hypothetical protein